VHRRLLTSTVDEDTRRQLSELAATTDRREYEGMTWNERLAAAGLLAAWDHAARRRDRGEMVRVLRSVETKPGDAEKTVEAVLANPHKFGL
jgi:hypothetical protein